MSDYIASSARDLRSEIAARLARVRLAQNVTQAALAEEAGVALRTVRRLEAGQSSSLDSFLRIAIALGLGDSIAQAIPSSEVRPIERVDARGMERRRARPVKDRPSGEPWVWGEETRD